MSDIPCIPANLDISGIGVRVAIYTQNFLSFVPAIYALWDKKITPEELDTVEDQSLTILITAFAILASAVIQAQTAILSNFHAAIILNLSWMNNTSTFIYFLLHLHHRLGSLQNSQEGHTERPDGTADRASSQIELVYLDTPRADLAPPTQSRLRWLRQELRLLSSVALIAGSIHLFVMAAIGIWLWSKPLSFGHSSSCPVFVVILGNDINIGSLGLRALSLFFYSLFLVPGLNLMIPVGFFYIIHAVYNHVRQRNWVQPSIVPVSLGLWCLAVINTIFLIDTEIAIERNKHLQQSGESEWSFGQILALLLLLAPLRDIFNAFRERQRKKLDRKDVEQMMSALQHGYWTVIDDLSKKGVNVEISEDDYQTLLRKAVVTQNPEQCVLLSIGYVLDHSAHFVERDTYTADMINMAIRQRNTEITRILLTYTLSKSLYNQNYIYGSALITASESRNLHIVQFLVNHGVDVNAWQGCGYGPALIIASYNGDFDIVRFLIEHKVDINKQGGTYGTVLQAASYSGHFHVVQFLVEHGADINAQGGQYGTALQAAAYRGYYTIVEFLVRHGAEIDRQGDIYNSALKAAFTGESHDITKFLVEHRAEIDVQDDTYGFALAVASFWGDLDLVKFLVDHGVNVNTQGGRYGSALQAASYRESLSIVRYLVECGADINTLGGEVGTALQAAVHRGNLPIVQFLVKQGADINVQDGEYGSILEAASYWGHFDIVQLLVENGANIEAQGGKYRSALDGYQSLVNYLSQNGQRG